MPDTGARTKRNKKGGGPWAFVDNMQNATNFFDTIVGPGGWKRKAVTIAAEAIFRLARR